MADVKFDVTRFGVTTAAAGNTQDVTISGFGTPKAAIFIVSNAVTDDTIADSLVYSIGYTDGTNQVCRGISALHNAANSNTASSASDVAVIAPPVFSSGSSEFEFAFDSFITDGVRISVTVAASTARLCTVILIGGADVTAHVGGIGLGTGTSAIDVNTIGFEPSVVFISTIGTSATVGTSTAASLSNGIAINDGADTQRFLGLFSGDTAAASLVSGHVSNSHVIGEVGNTGTVWRATIGSYDASGFSLTPSSSADSATVAYLCLKIDNAPDLYLGDMSWPTSGSYAETGPGFQPSFGFINSLSGPTARNSTNSTGTTLGVLAQAAFNASTIYTISVADDDAENIMECKSLSSDQLRIINQDGSADDVVASGYAFDADGWDFTLTTNPAAEVLGWALAIGAGATAALGIRNPLFGPVTLRNPLGRFN